MKPMYRVRGLVTRAVNDKPRAVASSASPRRRLATTPEVRVTTLCTCHQRLQLPGFDLESSVRRLGRLLPPRLRVPLSRCVGPLHDNLLPVQARNTGQGAHERRLGLRGGSLEEAGRHHLRPRTATDSVPPLQEKIIERSDCFRYGAKRLLPRPALERRCESDTTVAPRRAMNVMLSRCPVASAPPRLHRAALIARNAMCLYQ